MEYNNHIFHPNIKNKYILPLGTILTNLTQLVYFIEIVGGVKKNKFTSLGIKIL